MIISHGRRYIFVHIPKTGGTSVAQALEERAMKDDILIGDSPKALRRRNRVKKLQAAGRLWKHSTLADIDGLVSLAQIAGYFTFTLVRNPWDRLVSYYHWLQGQGFDHPAVDLSKQLDFNGFLNHPQIMASVRAAQSASYMTDATGAMHCDAFIRLEHFQTDAAPLFRHLGFAVQPERINPSRRDRDYRGYYTNANCDLVADLCAEDIRRFGYEFQSGLPPR